MKSIGISFYILPGFREDWWFRQKRHEWEFAGIYIPGTAPVLVWLYWRIQTGVNV